MKATSEMWALWYTKVLLEISLNLRYINNLKILHLESQCYMDAKIRLQKRFSDVSSLIILSQE